MKTTSPMRTVPAGALQTSAEDLLFILWRWKWSMAAILLMTMLLSGFWVFVVREDVYTPETKILVRPGLEQLAPPTVAQPQGGTVGYRSADVKSEVDVLSSTDLLNRLIDKYKLDQPQPAPAPQSFLQKIRFHLRATVHGMLEKLDDLYVAAGLRPKLTQREKTFEALRRGLSVKVIEGSNTITADLTLPFRQGSGAVLNALVDEYLKFRVNVYRTRGDEYFKSAMEQRASELIRAEAAKNGFERQEKLSGQQEEQSLLLQQLSDLEQARHNAEVEFRVAQAKLDQVNRESAKAQPNFAALGDLDSSPFQRTLLSDIASLRKRREELLLTEMDDSEKVKNTERQIQLLSDLLKANVRAVRDERQARLAAAVAERDKVQARLDQLHASQVRWSDLQRQTRSLEDEYELFRKKYNESAASRTALEQQIDENVVVLEHATDPLQPSGIRKTLLLGVALIAGWIAALTYVVIGEWLDPRIFTPKQLERETGLRVFGIAPLDPKLLAPSPGESR
jgi:uncharacterized protein involved in exopolysaccharide biosynthesis